MAETKRKKAVKSCKKGIQNGLQILSLDFWNYRELAKILSKVQIFYLDGNFFGFKERW